MRYTKDHKLATRRQFLDAGARVLRTHGYAAAGVDRLAAEAGLTSGAFYGHFKGKEDFLAEVVRESVVANEANRERGLEGMTGKPWFAAMLRRYLSEQHWQAVEHGCPIPCLISELSRLGEKPREAFAQAAREFIERIEQKLRASEPDPAARQRAMAGLAMAVGGLAIARAVGDDDLSREMLEACQSMGVEAILSAGGDHTSPNATTEEPTHDGR